MLSPTLSACAIRAQHPNNRRWNRQVALLLLILVTVWVVIRCGVWNESSCTDYGHLPGSGRKPRSTHALHESTCVLSFEHAIKRALKFPDEIVCAMAAVRI